MCVIFELIPGMSIDKRLLDNAIGNNLDGIGVVLKDPSVNRLQVIRKFRKEADGGPDNEELFDILEDNKDVIRYVHLRNQTKGDLIEENVHPFSVYHSDTRQIWMAHNGTSYKWAPKADDPRCDSRIFNDDFLSPLLLKFSGEFGKGDYNDPLVRKIIEEFIGTNNRLLLMSNDLEPAMIGTWHDIKNADGTTFKASNNDYFDTIKRGPRKPPTAVSVVNPWRGPQNISKPPYQPPTHPNVHRDTSSKSTAVTVVPERKIIPLEEAKALITEARKAREARTVTSLSELMNIPSTEDTMVEKVEEALDDKGYDEKYWKDYGFELIAWLKDEEILSLTKKLGDAELVRLIRCLAEIQGQNEEEMDVLEQQLNRTTKELTETKKELAHYQTATETYKDKHAKASQRIEQLVRGQPLENRIG